LPPDVFEHPVQHLSDTANTLLTGADICEQIHIKLIMPAGSDEKDLLP